VTISAAAINWASSSSFFKSISANTTFTFSNTTDGQTIVVAITNTSGTATVTWPGTVQWPGGNVPTQTVNGTDVYTFVDILGTIYGSVLQNFST
jgi:hypothetical protein